MNVRSIIGTLAILLSLAVFVLAAVVPAAAADQPQGAGTATQESIKQTMPETAPTIGTAPGGSRDELVPAGELGKGSEVPMKAPDGEFGKFLPLGLKGPDGQDVESNREQDMRSSIAF